MSSKGCPSGKKIYSSANTEEILELLRELDEEEKLLEDANEILMSLVPPECDNDTDCDDLLEEELTVTEDNPQLLGRGILSQQPGIQLLYSDGKKDLTIADNTPSLQDFSPEQSFKGNNSDTPIRKKARVSKKLPKRVAKWEEVELESVTLIMRTMKNKPRPDIIDDMIREGKGPLDFFKLFFDEEILKLVCDETIKCANYKFGVSNFTLDYDELMKVFGILYVSGYCQLPNRRMYWETKGDVNNAAISNSRDRFLSIFKFLHFNDNKKIDNDRCYKVRPLLDILNKNYLRYLHPLPNEWSFDEGMEPYYGRHSMKQSIRGKPIRFGFKFWCLCTPEGYCAKFDVYKGREERTEGMTLGSSVVNRMVVGVVPENSHIYLDNYFSSLPLLNEMRAKTIYCTGTIRSDRIEKAPLLDLKKQPRGSMCALKDPESGITLYRWHDNSQVTIATNRTDSIAWAKTKCTRYKADAKKKVEIPQPSIIREYNRGMGGVDLFDKNRGKYRLSIRSKKLYWPIVRFCFNSAMVNSWLLFRQIEPKITLLEFTRNCILPILATPMIARPRSVLPHRSGSVQSEIRYDRLDHQPGINPTQRRCAFCNKCVTHICLKCNVGLHIKCFVAYHTRNS